jgi:hypothetical protein
MDNDNTKRGDATDRLRRLVGKRILLCKDCAEKNGLIEPWRASLLWVFAGQGEGSCCLCGLDNGGADILIPNSELDRSKHPLTDPPLTPNT